MGIQFFSLLHSRRTAVLSITALVFIVLVGLSLDGFLWARIVAVLLSALITLLLLWAMLQDFLIFGSHTEPNNLWPLLLIQLLLPALGYGACAFLLLFPSVTDWQHARRDRRIQRYQSSQRIENLGDTEQVGDLKPCPWCEVSCSAGQRGSLPGMRSAGLTLVKSGRLNQTFQIFSILWNMQRFLLKSKIHRATVTEANLDYEGSVTIDEDLMCAGNIVPYEQVHIYDVTNGNRIITYAMVGPAGSGTMCINGAAAHKVIRATL